jgi:hypothetical protein
MLSNIVGPKPIPSPDKGGGVVLGLVSQTTILTISMKMKPHEKSLGHNPLGDASYRNPGMVLNEQGPGRHPLGDTPYLDLDTVLSE